MRVAAIIDRQMTFLEGRRTRRPFPILVLRFSVLFSHVLGNS